MSSKYEVEFSGTRKFERGIAEKQEMIKIISCVLYGNRVLAIYLDVWRIGH